MLQHYCDDTPSDADAWLMLAAASAVMDDLDGVIRACRSAIAIRPAYAPAHYNLGVALLKQGDVPGAIQAGRHAVAYAPAHANSHANLAKAHKDSGDFVNACAACEQALRIEPGHAVACNTMGLVLREQGMFTEALPWFERARTHDSGYAEAHWNWSLTALNLGHYRDGWSAFEWRWAYESRMQRQLPFPAWDGSHNPSTNLLVCAEQGIGDQVMFAGCVEDVLGMVDQVVLEAEPRLQPLFARSFPTCLCLTGQWDHDPACPGDITAHVHGGSLPGLFRQSPDSFPQHRGYLRADPERTQNWARRYATLPARLKVGISWRGGNDARTRQARSIALSEWLPILRCPGVEFINLQYGDHAAEVGAIRDQVSIHGWPESDPLKDLDDFAAQISALDLVISVDNTTVHMAGALGVPVWTLLPIPQDWRWVQGATTSPWYPSMKLFHQSERGQWPPVISAVADALACLATGGSR
jgi:hypothetical protein